jgi:signal recognition particle subunit SRP19
MESDNITTKTWIKIYPSYIDKELKHSEGRKVSNELAIEKPSAHEIYTILKNVFDMDCKAQMNHHPRDWMKRGRVIVAGKQDENSNLILNKKINCLKEYVRL